MRTNTPKALEMALASDFHALAQEFMALAYAGIPRARKLLSDEDLVRVDESSPSGHEANPSNLEGQNLFNLAGASTSCR